MHQKINNILIIFKKLIFDEYCIKSYSHEGEDLVINRILNNQNKGFYVDIGAHHPKRFSNTYFFYKRAWNGINIDAMPGSMKGFNKLRPKDINLEIAISDKNQTLTYYAFNEPALNTFSEKLALSYEKIKDYFVIFKKKIKTFQLSEILDKYLPEGQKIDFLSIDVEGLDFEVLNSNNWDKYTPKVILIESLNNSLEQVLESDIYKFLSSKGYVLFSKTINTLFFVKT